MTTSIQIEDKTWERLNKMKLRGETFDDVIVKLLKTKRGKDGQQKD